MKINREKLLELYLKEADQIAEVCDWKKHFGPVEIVNILSTILEKNKKELLEREQLKVIQRDYSWECGDGCCDESGKEWYINDSNNCIHRSPCEDNGWLAVLAELGFNMEIEWQDTEGGQVAGL